MRRIAIIGLGFIGGSLGIALRKAYGKDLEIVGHDREHSVAKKAEQIHAVDRATTNLSNAVSEAQMVVLATPIMAIRELMELISPRLQEGCIVTDTANVKQTVQRWAEAYLPPGVSFIGGNPLINKSVHGLDGPQHDLFENALYCLCPSPQANQGAVRVVTDMVKGVGARPYFIDIAEHDSYAAITNQLPLVMASTMVTVAAKTDSWRDISKQATAHFEEISRLVANDPLDNLDSCITNKDALLHWLDQAIHELVHYRRVLEEDTEGLGQAFSSAFQARNQWLRRREAGFPHEEIPKVPHTSFGDRMGALIVGEQLMERYRRMEDGLANREGNRPRRARE